MNSVSVFLKRFLCLWVAFSLFMPSVSLAMMEEDEFYPENSAVLVTPTGLEVLSINSTADDYQLEESSHPPYEGSIGDVTWLETFFSDEDIGHLKSVLSREEDIEKKVDCKDLSPNFEAKILSSFQNGSRPQAVIAIHNSALLSLTHLGFDAFKVKSPHLRFLDLRGAQQGDANFFKIICDVCTNLEYLNISRWQKIKKLAAFKEGLLGLTVQENPILEKLIRLVANDCPQLEDVDIYLPKTKWIEMNGGNKLRRLKVGGWSLENVYASRNPLLKEMILIFEELGVKKVTARENPKLCGRISFQNNQYSQIYLDLSGNPWFTFESMCQLMKSEPHLDRKILVSSIVNPETCTPLQKRIIQALERQEPLGGNELARLGQNDLDYVQNLPRHLFNFNETMGFELKELEEGVYSLKLRNVSFSEDNILSKLEPLKRCCLNTVELTKCTLTLGENDNPGEKTRDLLRSFFTALGALRVKEIYIRKLCFRYVPYSEPGEGRVGHEFCVAQLIKEAFRNSECSLVDLSETFMPCLDFFARTQNCMSPYSWRDPECLRAVPFVRVSSPSR